MRCPQFLTIIQMKAPEAKPTAWLVAGLAWSACAAIAFFSEPIWKKPDFYITVGLNSAFGVAFLAASLTAGPTKPTKGKKK